MKPRSLAAAAVAAFFMAAVSGAQAAKEPQHVRHGSRVTATVTASRIGALRSQVWSCQQQAELPLSRAGQQPREVASVGVGYAAWVAGLWHGRLASCRSVLARTLPATNDWQTAVRIVQRVYPRTDWWLLSCSASEGGHGPFVYHGGRVASAYEISHAVEVSTPGGQLQYFPGTFWSDFDAAVQDLAARGVRVPRSAFTWYSPLGQALAGGWAYGHARPAGKWTGGGC